MQEYPVSKSYSILFGAIFFFGGIVLGYFGVHNDRLFLLIPAGIFVTVGVFTYVTMDRLRVTVDDEEITSYNGLKTRTLLLKEIDGYRLRKGKWNIPWYTITQEAVLISPRKATAAVLLPGVEDRSPVYRAAALSADRYGK